MAPKLIPAPRPVRMAQVAAPSSLRPPGKVPHNPEAHRRAMPEGPRDESLSAVHSAAGRHYPLDGWRPARGLGRLPAIAHLTSRTPTIKRVDLLSRRQPGRHGFLGHGAPRAPVRPDPRLEPDDLHELLWQLDYHPPIRPGLEH